MVAIIPARGGSKGVPRKNIKEIGGMPLIAHTIKAARDSKNIHRVIVTTEDLEIADVARQYGAEIPFIRPKELAQDNSMAQDVYLHAAEYLMEHDKEDMSSFVVLLATAPFRTGEHIDMACELWKKNKAKTLVSIKKVETPVTWLFKKDKDDRIVSAGFDREYYSGNRQSNPVYYVPNGAIYILNYELLKREKTYFCDNTLGYLMSGKDSIDIDTIEDFEYAEYRMRNSI